MPVGEIKYLVGLSGWPGFGGKRLEFLLKELGSAARIWQLGPKLNPAWQNKLDLDQSMAELTRQGVKTIALAEEAYPRLLKESDNPPFLLFIKGQMAVLNESALTVVGTRKMTEYGQRATTQLIRPLSKRLVIISGLARGIDGWAHRECLRAGGKTVAVLGHGLERIYPPEHRGLAEAIISHGGALVSEFPLHYPLAKPNFPRRDRILAGLSLGTLVIEGGEKSGTKITAGMAADYGREVFCVPGPIDSPTAAGPASLIQQGAKLVTKAEDIFEELIFK